MIKPETNTTIPATPRSKQSGHIALNDVRIRYRSGSPAVLDGLQLEIGAGRIVALLGPSGCGKTTLLNAIAGFVAPERGRITVDSCPVEGPSPRLGVVFQDLALFPWLDVIGNVEFGLKMAGFSRGERRRRALDQLARVGLEQVAHSALHELSGGMRQRVALARTLATEPSILLLDEPFSALDAITREQMHDHLMDVVGPLGKTVVFVTHQIDEAIYLADEVVVLAGQPTAAIVERVEVELPRPRRAALRASQAFGQYRRKLFHTVRGGADADESAPILAPKGD